MMHKELVFVRHGETALNKLGVVQGSGLDPGLNDTGLAQSQRLFEKYRDHPFDLVITSALRRTHETVRPFIESGLPWEQYPEINEISWGDHEGKPATPEMTDRYDRMIAAWGRGELDASLPNGESAAELIARVDRFLAAVFERPESHILICSHGRTLRCIVSRLKGLPPAAMEDVWHSNTGVFHGRGAWGEFDFLVENDLTHLS